MALLPARHIAKVIEVYRHRYIEIARDPRIEQVIIFKNHGSGAGTSLIHPHSQLIALPMVPAHIRHRMEESMRYFDERGECVMCENLRMELDSGVRIVDDNERFTSFVPYASYSPFHLWIVPKRHSHCFSTITDEEIADLAECLGKVLVRLLRGLDDPDYNIVVNSSPLDGGKRHSHWYISVVPRVTKAAGFELGSGMFINSSLPEENAGYLRGIEVD